MNAGGVPKTCKSNVSCWRLEVRSWKCYNQSMKDFHDLEAYQNSKKLYPIIVKITTGYPRVGFRLGDQSRRAANGIHACIAEGWGRSVVAFKEYLTRSLGSNNELISHIEDAQAVGYISPDVAKDLIEQYTIIGKQLYRLRENWH